MSQLLLSKKKYNFKIGYIIKVGNNFYQIIGIEPFHHYELINSVNAESSGDQSFESNLKPSEGFINWIEELGIDGALGFQLKFPAVPRWTVHGNKRYLYRHQASFMNKLYMPFLVQNPEYPRFTFYNPELVAETGVMFFKGERWLVIKISQNDVGDYWADLTSYSDKNVGEG